MSLQIENPQFTVAIGARFDDDHASKTESIAVSLDLASIEKDKQQECLQYIINRGLGAIVSEVKAAMPKDATRAQFRELICAYGIEQLTQDCLRIRQRGRAASEYPQAMRVLDAQNLRKAQQSAMLKNQFMMLPLQLEHIITSKGKTDCTPDDLEMLGELASRDDVVGQCATRIKNWLAATD